ncbi:MAG: hypothetical protein CVU00_05860 [Bacteroidetes bacterium HGW-Bacteroidetes-17]|jgi:hypothetical protein|nr:MAG: hypothetical protein CVU00_05860 [Bacteroidetes bacterium HGW-Bacteroidetes-17]
MIKTDYQHSKIYVALPAMDEFLYLPQFIECIKAQTFRNFHLIVCVNQPESWWFDQDKLPVCENNQKCIQLLQKQHDINTTIIDKSTQGNGWEEKKSGVGWARKIIMDHIVAIANENDIILSLDADTTFRSGYFQSIIDNFKAHPKDVTISVPYYHPLTENENQNRHILRYEIYMRYYALNLWRINNPYNFSALGSAIAVPVWVYKRVGGLSPHKSGEDFYFLLKLRKFGQLRLWNCEKVYPSARYSSRVLFGTGPAMIKGASGDWSSYPIYDFNLFNEVGETYVSFIKLFNEDIKFPMKDFLAELFKDANWFEALKKNSSSIDQFVKACQHKVDALRILQYLKFKQKEYDSKDEEILNKYISEFHNTEDWQELSATLGTNWSFEHSPVSVINELRDFLVKIEEKYQTNG